MQVNIYKDKMPGARLFGTSVLYSAKPIPREDVPQGWYCYDLRGTARHPDEPHALVELAEENHAGSILSYLPLKKSGSQFRLVKDMFQMNGTYSTPSEFCAKESIRCPETPIRYLLCPAFPEEAGLFYAQTPERDEELGAIGHVRIDFGYHGREGFYHTWWPRGPEELNTQEFREELDRVVNDLRKGVLKDLPSMRRYCYGSEGVIEGGTCCQNYGFTLETGRYLYRLRCNPIEGDYQAYLSCFDKQTQQMGLTEQGRQRLRNAADPTLPHRYEWYVIEYIHTPERRIDHDLPLEEAIQLYAGLDCADKRLGVTKDSISAVDLAIRWDGREKRPLDDTDWRERIHSASQIGKKPACRLFIPNGSGAGRQHLMGQPSEVLRRIRYGTSIAVLDGGLAQLPCSRPGSVCGYDRPVHDRGTLRQDQSACGEDHRQ